MLHPLTYTPPGMEQSPAPYVYFHARRDAVSGQVEFGVSTSSTTFTPFSYTHAAGNVCVPYMNGTTSGNYATPTTVRPWAGEQPYQIICAGLTDGNFGVFSQNPSATVPDFRNLTTGEGISQADFDNITSFAQGKLENAMPR